MEVLILSTKLPYPPRDGGAIATLNLASGLAETGAKVTMLTFNTSKHFTDTGTIPAEIRDQITILPVYKNVSIKPLKAAINLLFSREPYIASRYHDKTFSKALIEILKDGHFDFVQLEGPYLGQYIPLIRKYSKARISLRAHNVEHRIWEMKYRNEAGKVIKWYTGILAKRIRKLEKELLEKIDLLIPISDEDASDFHNYHDVPSVTIPAGLHLAEYPQAVPDATGKICFIGALDWMPNQEGLQWFVEHVLPELALKRPGIQFHVAGRNAPVHLVRQLQQDSIHYHGEVEDARSFMQQFSILAVPLITGSGIRIKILEGMAMGMCIVTTKQGASGLPAENGKHLLVEDEPGKFAQRLLELLDNGKLRKNMSAAARKMVQENFDTFAIASRLEEMYKQMV